MAVYERTYRRYTGALTSERSRLWILPRYIFRDVFRSRWMVAFYCACFIFPLFCAIYIYLANNADVLLAVPDFQLPKFLQINANFFFLFLRMQGVMAFALALLVGPGLISRDLTNNGLPLYLSRPFTRTEYVVGKLSVLALLLSSITWVPALGLMLIHASFAGFGWLGDNVRLMVGVFFGSWLWILTLGLLALSASAWVKWRPVAAFTMLLMVLGGAFFGSLMINHLFDTRWGHLLNLLVVTHQTWAALLGLSDADALPLGALVFSLACFLGFFLFLLHRKIRAYEVVS